MKKNVFKYFRRTRKLLETKPYQRDNYPGYALVSYSGPFLKWTRKKNYKMDQKSRKLITMHKAFHLKDGRLYVPRKEGGRGLISIEDIVDASIQRLEEYIYKRGGRLISAIRSNTYDARISRTTITRKQKWEEKQLYRRFEPLIRIISHKRTWTRIRKGNLKRKNESLLIAAQSNTIRTNPRIVKMQ